MHAVLAALPVGMMLVDEQGDVVDANPALLDMLGRDCEELVGRPAGAVPLLVDHRGEPLPSAHGPLARCSKEAARRSAARGSTCSSNGPTALASPPSPRPRRSIRATGDRLKALADNVEVSGRTRGTSLAYLDDGEFAVVLTGLRR